MAAPLMALAGGQMLLSIMQGRASAKAQNEVYEQNADNAITAGVLVQRGVNERLRQEQDVAGQNKRQLLAQMIQAKSTRAARGSELEGVSLDRITRSIENQVGQAISDIDYNLSGAILNAETQKESVNAKAESRINSVTRAEFDPTYALLEGGLNIATASKYKGNFQS